MVSVKRILIGLLLLILGLSLYWNPIGVLISSIISLTIFAIIFAFCFASIGIYLFFYHIIPGISVAVSKLCVYHKLKSEKYPEGETLWKKISLVFLYNFILTIPMLLTILYLLNPSTLKMSGRLELSGIDIGLIIALSIISGLFLTLRLIGNPTYHGIFFSKIVIKRSFSGCSSDIEKTKDYISSFFSTLIIGTVLFLFLLYSSDYLSSQSFFTFFKRYIPTMAPFEFSLYIIAYFGTLFIITVIGEVILERCEPLDQE